MAPLALALIASLALHMGALVALADSPEQAAKKKAQAEVAARESARAKGKEKRVNRLGEADGESLGATAIRARVMPALAAPTNPGEGKGARPKADCPAGAYYAGIGVVFSANGVIDLVAAGGPADQAGLLVGDVVAGAEPPLLGPDKYAIGQSVMVVVSRGGAKLARTMRVAEICYETGQRP